MPAGPEALCGDNAYVCEECAKRRTAAGEDPGRGEPALKWLQVAQVPSVLTLHLKRFRSTGRRVNKLDEHVPFPASLNLGPFVCAPGKPATQYEQLGAESGGGLGGESSSGQAASIMRLYGVVEHEGTFASGHYLAYVRLDGRWYRMSDSFVSEVSEDEVLRKQAFMLFYERAAA